MKRKKMNHKTIATLLAIIPGFGHFYNRQYWQGGSILAIMAAYMCLTMNTVVHGAQGGGIVGLFTLGTVPGRDHSLFFLVEGLLSLILIAVGLGIYVFSILDARKNGRKRDEGETIYSMRDHYHAVMNRGFPYLIMAPGIIAMVLSVVFPIITTVMISMTNYNINHMPPKKLFSWVGLKNYVDMFTMDSWKNAMLYTLSWTLIWTVCATMLTIVMGILVAVTVNQKEIHFKKFWRTIIILPWAVPAFISILMFSVFFNDSFGAMNQQVIPFFNKLLPFLKLQALPWKTQAVYTRLALILIQGWLGFPYIFVMVTGVLQSIPGDLYEAAQMDGASRFQQFSSITLPWILSATAPVLITQFTFNFSNFNIIYLFNSGGPVIAGQLTGGTDLLVSWVYKITSESVTREFGMGAAITVFVSLVVMAVALTQYVHTDAFKGGNEK